MNKDRKGYGTGEAGRNGNWQKNTSVNGNGMVSEMKLPLVRLAASNDAKEHKKPVDKDWPNLTPTFAQAKQWVRQGGGIGLNLFASRSLTVIDIDENTYNARAIADQLGSKGAIVCKTLRGYHIMIKRRVDYPPSGRYQLTCGNITVEAEFYKGGQDDGKCIVLPVAGTPRARLGGGVLWLGGQLIGGQPLSLEEFIEAFGRVPDLHNEFVLHPIKNHKNSDTKPKNADTENSGFLKNLTGKLLYTFGDVVEAVRQNPPKPGERHNFFVSLASAVRHRFGEEEVRQLFDLMREVWGPDFDEDEAEGIINWAINEIEVKEEGANKQRKVTRSQQLFEELFERMSALGAKVYVSNSEKYILVDGYALRKGDIRDWVIKKFRAVLGKETAEDAAAGLMQWLPYYEGKAIILSGGVEFLADQRKVYVLLRGGKIWEASEDGLKIYDTPPEGIYRLWGSEIFAREYHEVDELDEIITVFGILSQRDGRLATALFAPIITNVATGIVFIEGERGAGKSTLNEFVTALASPSGFNAFGSAGKDLRDWIAVLKHTNVLGIDEAQNIDEEKEAFIKSVITGQTVTNRKLYTDNDIVAVELRRSFVFSSVDHGGFSGDLARRAAILKLKREKGRRDVDQEAFRRAIKKYADVFFCSIFRLIPEVFRIVKSGRHELKPSEALLGAQKANDDKPKWVAEDSKADWAQYYYAFCKILNVDENTAKQFWKEVRAAAAEKGLGVWEEVLDVYTENADFRKNISENGLAATDIAKYILKGKDKEDQSKIKSKATSLTRKAPAVKGALADIGFELEILEGKDKAGRTRRLFRLFKVEEEDDNSGSAPSTPAPQEPKADTKQEPKNETDMHSRVASANKEGEIFDAIIKVAACPQSLQGIMQAPWSIRDLYRDATRIFEDEQLNIFKTEEYMRRYAENPKLFKVFLTGLIKTLVYHALDRDESGHLSRIGLPEYQEVKEFYEYCKKALGTKADFPPEEKECLSKLILWLKECAKDRVAFYPPCTPVVNLDDPDPEPEPEPAHEPSPENPPDPEPAPAPIPEGKDSAIQGFDAFLEKAIEERTTPTVLAALEHVKLMDAAGLDDWQRAMIGRLLLIAASNEPIEKVIAQKDGISVVYSIVDEIFDDRATHKLYSLHQIEVKDFILKNPSVSVAFVVGLYKAFAARLMRLKEESALKSHRKAYHAVADISEFYMQRIPEEYTTGFWEGGAIFDISVWCLTAVDTGRLEGPPPHVVWLSWADYKVNNGGRPDFTSHAIDYTQSPTPPSVPNNEPPYPPSWDEAN